MLSSILAQHSYLPRQLQKRGDKLVFSNGILLLGGFAIALIVGFNANIDKLIQLYIIGVFTSFTLSQFGMVKHWKKKLADAPRSERRSIRTSRVINFVGALATASRAGDRALRKGAGRRVDRDRCDGAALRRDEGHPAPLQRGHCRTRHRGRREPDDALAQSRGGVGLSPAPARAARARLRQGDPSEHDRGGHHQRRRGRSDERCRSNGRRAASTSHSSCWIRLIAR